MAKCYYSPFSTTNLLVGAYYRVQRLLQLKIETDLTKKRLMENWKALTGGKLAFAEGLL
jgi:hypothetical protein